MECNLKLVSSIFSFVNTNKITLKPTHDSRRCGLAQDLHIEVQTPAKARLNLHTTQDVVD